MSMYIVRYIIGYLIGRSLFTVLQDLPEELAGKDLAVDTYKRLESMDVNEVLESGRDIEDVLDWYAAKACVQMMAYEENGWWSRRVNTAVKTRYGQPSLLDPDFAQIPYFIFEWHWVEGWNFDRVREQSRVNVSRLYAGKLEDVFPEDYPSYAVPEEPEEGLSEYDQYYQDYQRARMARDMESWDAVPIVEDKALWWRDYQNKFDAFVKTNDIASALAVLRSALNAGAISSDFYAENYKLLSPESVTSKDVLFDEIQLAYSMGDTKKALNLAADGVRLGYWSTKDVADMKIRFDVEALAPEDVEDVDQYELDYQSMQRARWAREVAGWDMSEEELLASRGQVQFDSPDWLLLPNYQYLRDMIVLDHDLAAFKGVMAMQLQIKGIDEDSYIAGIKWAEAYISNAEDVDTEDYFDIEAYLDQVMSDRAGNWVDVEEESEFDEYPEY